MSFDIFPKYGQTFIIKIQKICLLTFRSLEIMARNYKLWKISWTLNLNISFGHCLHIGYYGFFESLGFTFILWKKVCVQAMAWGWAMVRKSLFVQNALLKITHNGVGLRSDIRRGGFLASSNILLSVYEEKNSCSSGNKSREVLEVTLFSYNFTLKFSLATVCFYLATAR